MLELTKEQMEAIQKAISKKAEESAVSYTHLTLPTKLEV